jgi:hypothetical protein
MHTQTRQASARQGHKTNFQYPGTNEGEGKGKLMIMLGMKRGAMMIRDGGGPVWLEAVRVIACCARSRGGLPVQVLGQQPHQHHRQRGLCRTDRACSTVRRGTLGLSCLFVACCFVFAWMWGAEGVFPRAYFRPASCCNGMIAPFLPFLTFLICTCLHALH